MTWQIVILAVVVLLPLALLADFHPSRERVDSRGVPLPRPWERSTTRSPDAEHH